MATTLTYKPDTYTTMALELSRFLEESTDASNPYYVANNVNVDIKHAFPRKIKAGVNLGLTIDKYQNNQPFGPEGIRRDDIYQGGCWVEYDIQKWLSTGLSYFFRERDSTFSSQFNYQDHQVTWNAAFKF